MIANAYRGEAPLQIGPVNLVIAIEFGGLARFSAATGLDDIAAIMRALIGFSPARAALALECFTIDGDWKEAVKHLSLAHSSVWREAFSLALADHMEKSAGPSKPKDGDAPKH